MEKPKPHSWPNLFRLWLIPAFCLWLAGWITGCAPTKPGTPRAKENAEQQLLKAVAQARKLDPANPLLLSSLYSLAEFFRSQREFSKAESIYQQALSLKEQANGPDHPDVATILENYAALLRESDRPEEAQQLESQAKAIRAKHLHTPSSSP